MEDAIRTGKDVGLGHFPSHDFAVNAAGLTAAMAGQILLAWLKLLTLVDGLAANGTYIASWVFYANKRYQYITDKYDKRGRDG